MTPNLFCGVCYDLVGRVFEVVDFYDCVCGKVSQVHRLPFGGITGGDFVDGFDGAHVGYPRLREVQHDVIRVPLDIELLLKYRGNANEVPQRVALRQLRARRQEET